MGSYIPNPESVQKEMLDFLGLESLDDLYIDLPESIKLKKDGLNIPNRKSELEVVRMMEKLANKNKVFGTVFRGAGVYKHYIPSIVGTVTSKEKFITTYTPYQAEISQGVLQNIFEFQTMICELTGMDASNASIYDGASGCAEAINMCVERRRNKAFVSETMNPKYIQTIKTYAFGGEWDIVMVPEKDGKTDIDFIKENIDDKTTACVIMQQPNYYGILEDADKLGEIAHENKAKFIMSVNPVSTALLKTPREYGADIAVGEGQPLGMSMSFGGPHLGFMTCTEDMLRKLPGRIVGETVDEDGKRAYVLTLQAREQHIRRERASSNVCSNQALCALTASVFMTAMGPKGMKEMANQSLSKAHYAANEIGKIDGYELVFNDEFFHEFVTTCPVDVDKLMAKLEENNMLGGLPLEGKYENHILWCFTELNTKEEIDKLVGILKEGV